MEMVKYQISLNQQKQTLQQVTVEQQAYPPIGDSFMYIETSSNKNGDNVFCSFKRTDNIQISNKTFYYNRFSAENTKSLGSFRIQLLLEDNTWSAR